MSERVRTVLAVALLTATLWVWTDLEQQDTATLTVPVRVIPPTGYDVVERTVTPDAVRVTVRGRRGEIQQLKANEEVKVCRFTLTGEDIVDGRATLRTREGFRHWLDLGVTVSEIRTETGEVNAEVRARLVRFVRVTVPVEIEVQGATAAAKAAQPASVTAVVTEANLAAVPEMRRHALAVLRIEAMPEDAEVTREVSLEPRLGGRDGMEAKFEPPIVTVTARLESAVIQKTLPPLPVEVAGPLLVLGTYRVVFQEDASRVVHVKVEGPPKVVDPLTERQVQVQLELTPEDRPAVQGAWLSRVPVVYGLPPGVRLAEPLSTINFNLERRDAAPPAP